MIDKYTNINIFFIQGETVEDDEIEQTIASEFQVYNILFQDFELSNKKACVYQEKSISELA